MQGCSHEHHLGFCKTEYLTAIRGGNSYFAQAYHLVLVSETSTCTDIEATEHIYKLACTEERHTLDLMHADWHWVKIPCQFSGLLEAVALSRAPPREGNLIRLAYSVKRCADFAKSNKESLVSAGPKSSQ